MHYLILTLADISSHVHTDVETIQTTLNFLLNICYGILVSQGGLFILNHLNNSGIKHTLLKEARTEDEQHQLIRDGISEGFTDISKNIAKQHTDVLTTISSQTLELENKQHEFITNQKVAMEWVKSELQRQTQQHSDIVSAIESLKQILEKNT